MTDCRIEYVYCCDTILDMEKEKETVKDITHQSLNNLSGHRLPSGNPNTTPIRPSRPVEAYKESVISSMPSSRKGTPRKMDTEGAK